MNFMIVGHTHDDIDALFGRWSMLLKKENFPTIPALMKSFMNMESIPTIPHLIEEVHRGSDCRQGRSFGRSYKTAASEVLLGWNGVSENEIQIVLYRCGVARRGGSRHKNVEGGCAGA